MIYIYKTFLMSLCTFSNVCMRVWMGLSRRYGAFEILVIIIVIMIHMTLLF